MKVRDVMTAAPESCGFDTNLAEAAEALWRRDCGVLPVVEGGKLVGVITDRDICIALGTRGRSAGETAVREVAARQVHTCSAEDPVEEAMAAMQRARVRRLPVVDGDGKLEGILALNDIVLAVDDRGAITSANLINTLKSVSQHQTSTTPGPVPAGKATEKVKTVGVKG